MREVGQKGHEPIDQLEPETRRKDLHPGGSDTKEGRGDNRADPMSPVGSPGEPEQADLSVSPCPAEMKVTYREAERSSHRHWQSRLWLDLAFCLDELFLKVEPSESAWPV